ncbi:MAG: protein kinase, partial [Gemmatimonadales bacterium]
MTDQLDCLTTALAGRYKLERELGAGGMATVYLAHDVKHDRKVAVKVLRPELAAVLGAERFVQEIKTTANLQHPHILPLFDSGEADGFLYYVMPFIEGETLRGKLNRETQLGIEEAVKIATDVADALDYAHRHNVIHRDIKPENILLHDGRPIVADFGIALAVSAAAGGRMTETGFSLGTPHYMSPEQATAEKDLTNRSDIYSLGAVLYETLTGDPPHTGSSAQQIIMKIVTDEARPVTELRKSVPPNVAAATAKALEKLPADRFASAAAFARALRDVTAIPPVLSPKRLERAAVTRTAHTGWVVGTIGVALVAWALFGSRGESNPQSVRYLNIMLPDSAPLVFIGEGTLGAGRRALALSPDGQTLVYAASGRGSDQLYRRELADFMATPIAGTDSAFSPFISPDGQWVGFFVGAELRKASMGGGAAVRLAPVPESIGAAWNHDGRILVSAREGGVLGWVPEGGGPIQEIPNPQAVRRTHPSILPDGRHALVEIFNRTLVGPIVGVTDLESGRTEALTAAGLVVTDSVEPSAAIRGMEPQYLSSGHLVYSTPAGLVAVAFDPVKLELKGRPVEVLSGVRRDALGVQYAVGKGGTLVFAAGGDGSVGALVWASRDGAVDSLGFAPQPYGTFELSPDGQRLAALVYPAIGAAQ